MLGIAAQAAAFAVFDIDEQAASVGAIERAHRVAKFGGQAKIIAIGERAEALGVGR
jgi:hypothetical protein